MDGDWHANERTLAECFSQSHKGSRRYSVKNALPLLEDAAGRAEFIQRARRVLFRKAREHHDYKFLAAAFEEAGAAAPDLEPRLLAACFAYLPSEAQVDGRAYQLGERQLERIAK